MTPQEFIDLPLYAPVRVVGQSTRQVPMADKLIVMKYPGQRDGPLATKEQHERFSMPSAHAWADGGIWRWGVRIGGLEDLERRDDEETG